MTRVHLQVWRHTNAGDMRRIVQAAVLATLMVLPLSYSVGQISALNPPLMLLALFFLLLGMMTGRLISRGRATGQILSAFRPLSAGRPNAIIIGTAEEISEMISAQHKRREGLPVRPLGIIETGGAHKGRAICGIQVLGDLESLDHFLAVLTVRFDGVPWIALAGKPQDKSIMDAILDCASRHGATVQRLRRNSDNGVEPISPSDLLSRPERKLDKRLSSDLVSGARVFVTGAGGTIGSELVRQCAALGPAEIALFDASEYNLYEIDLQLRETFPNVTRRAFLGDVRDRTRLEEAMGACQPDLVIHAAALKHVPLMETNPNEAILTNIQGAQHAATISAALGVKSFVFISTDKAVKPANVMGATKRAAELFIQSFAATQTNTRFSMVRFGNVLGSAGSVAPLFERQIERGGPVTVTHEDMTRYFMSVEEASSLVLQAAALSSRSNQHDASLYVLDMAEPVSIISLAERMIRLKGMRPDKDIKITITGLRPGEKLNEAVFYADEDVQPTEIEGVLRARMQETSGELLLQRLERLIEAARKRERNQAVKLLTTLSPELSGCSRESAESPDMSNIHRLSYHIAAPSDAKRAQPE